MRYYDIAITGGPSFTSLVNGRTSPGALNVEMDVFAFNYSTPSGGGTDVQSWVRIWGVPLSLISQASDLNGKEIIIKGGMAKGLPLATAAANQAGVLVRGKIYPAFGNWIGTDMTLDLVLSPYTGSAVTPTNVTQDWKKNTKMSDAIKATLKTALPNLKPKIEISDKLILPYDSPWVYQTLQQFADFCRTISVSILGAGASNSKYPGVNMTIKGDTVYVYDGTQSSGQKSKAIQFRDMIGQPTWLGAEINFKTMMRADLQIGDIIEMPNAIPIQTPLSSLARTRPTFRGKYQVTQARHLGNYRQPDAGSWATVFNAVAVNG